MRMTAKRLQDLRIFAAQVFARNVQVALRLERVQVIPRDLNSVSFILKMREVARMSCFFVELKADEKSRDNLRNHCKPS